MEQVLKILILEDSEFDVDLIKRLLQKANMNCEFSIAMNKEAFLLALKDFSPDVILSDNSLPQFNATEALKITREQFLHIPFILVTGTVSEDFAVTMIKSGADDYILKDRITRLPAAIEAAVKQRRTEKDKQEALERLRENERATMLEKIQEQKKIARAIIIAQEKERTHLGQELHDNISQILTGAKMFMSVAGNKNETVKELIKYPLELIDSSITEIRLLSRKLVTPLQNINLEELIQGLIINLHKNKEIQTDFVYAVSNELISDELKLNIHRIMQEQINNILKYAEAKNVCITIKKESENVLIIVTDDGKGFDVNSEREGIGISNMTNRIETFNGTMQIESSIGNGCRTSISIPYYFN